MERSTLLARVWSESGENTPAAESRVIEQTTCEIESGELILTGNFKGQREGWRITGEKE